MKNTSLIQKFANEIAETFPSTSIWYEFNPLSNVHFLRVEPVEVFNTKAFRFFGGQLYLDWLQTSYEGEEEFCIIGPESLTKLEKPELICSPIKEVKLLVDGEVITTPDEVLEPCQPLNDFYIWIDVNGREEKLSAGSVEGINDYKEQAEKYSLAA